MSLHKITDIIEAAKWLKKEELDSVEWLPADITIVDKVRELL